MPGTVRQWGAELTLNEIAGVTVPVLSGVAPTWVPGLYWIANGSGLPAPSLATTTTGGTVPTGTYQAIITYVNPWGETLGSASASIAVSGAGPTLTVNAPPANGPATGWYAYVTQAGGSTYYRQQAPGSPTAIGTGLTLTANPTTSGLNPPTSSTLTVLDWNGSSWVTSPAPGTRYLALLITDPATSGPAGGPAVNVSDLFEDTTTGYARQPVTFSSATAGPPSALSNSGTLTFGPYTANQAAPVKWAALVTSLSGTSGLLLYTWNLDTVQQVSVSQSTIFPPGTLSLGQQ